MDDALREIGGCLIYGAGVAALWALGALARVAWDAARRRRVRSHSHVG